MKRWYWFAAVSAAAGFLLTSCSNAGSGGNAASNYSPSSWRLQKLPDTGQTIHYSTALGDDADYTVNPPSFMDNGDGTITDNVTTLLWQKQDDGTTRTWQDAGSYCAGLSLADYVDWRLPNDIELMSIADYGKENPGIDSRYFSNTQCSYYWSSSAYASDPGAAWSVNFGNCAYGSLGLLQSGSFVVPENKTNAYYVRCVRGGRLDL